MTDLSARKIGRQVKPAAATKFDTREGPIMPTLHPTLAQMAAEFSRGMALQQATGLVLLRSELEALMQVMPGLPHDFDLLHAGAQAQFDDEFDNLPV